MRHILGLALLLMLLTACGVRVELASLPPPTPTDRPWWRLYHSGDGSVERVLALPVISFGDVAEPGAQLFMQQPEEKIVLLQYRDLWLPVHYTVAWYDAPQSSAVLNLAVYTRRSEEDAWELYDRTEQRPQTDQSPARIQDTVGLTLRPSETGFFYVRAEITLNAALANGETVILTDAREFEMHVLPEPGETSWTPAELQPAFEGITSDVLLLDWRGWAGGPCALAERAGGSAAEETLQQACDAWNNGDLWSIGEAISQVETEDFDLAPDVLSVAGLLLLYYGDPSRAAEVFASAADIALATGDVTALTTHEHNLAVAQMAMGDYDSGWRTISCVVELLDQYWNEASHNLHYANVAFLNRDFGGVDNAYWWFANNGLSAQAITLEEWRFEIENGITD
jgi:hypothetical protein